jgi:uridine kinase
LLLFDGVFLMRRELLPHWDFIVYLHVDPEETLRRALKRDGELFGTRQRVVERYTGGACPHNCYIGRKFIPRRFATHSLT